MPAADKPSGSWLRRFLLRDDPVYDRYASTYQAKSRSAKIIYLLLYLLPGTVAYVFINVGPVFRAELALTHLSAKNLQYVWVLLLTFGWHMFGPLLMLRYADKLTLRESFAFLGLNRLDWRGLLFVLPVFCAMFAFLSIPYMRLIWTPLQSWLQSVPFLGVPSYSIFQQDVPDNIYTFPPFALAFIFIGNFLGEELYFRGYLMKKTSFLGRWNWTVNSLLFALYHLWQIPQTWPLIVMVLAFGLLMWMRKDLYVMVIFHLFGNMWLAYGGG
jgi:membrane protease YdiL (CAAX protease family)